MFEGFKSFLKGSTTEVTKAKPIGSFADYLFQFIGVNTVPPRRGTKELLETYSESPWIRTIVNKIGKAVGDTNWRLYSGINSKATKDDIAQISRVARKSFDIRQTAVKQIIDINKVKEIFDHPMLDLLEHGNEAMSGKSVIQLTTQYIDLVGEAFLLMEKDSTGTPVAIWPIPPHWVRSVPTETYPFYMVSADVANKSQIEIPVGEIIWLKEFDPLDPYKRGTGISKSLADEIETDEYAARYTKAFFFNNAKPSLIISGDNISREDTKRLEQKMKNEHTGWMNSFKPMFFSRKIDIKELTATLENMQMTQIRQQERDIIQQVFNVPPEVLGIIKDSSRSTVLSADYFFQKNIINPRCEQIRSCLQRELVPYFGGNLILDYDSPIMEDRDYKLKVMQFGTWAFTINEWRAEANLPSLGAEGEVMVVPLNQGIVPADSLTDYKAGMESSNVSEMAAGHGKSKPKKNFVNVDFTLEEISFLKEIADKVENNQNVSEDDLQKVKLLLREDLPN